MTKMKTRHNPEKFQNQIGGDKKCPQFDMANGKEFCHQEQFDIPWSRYDSDGNLLCKGNIHVCKKNKYKWLASLSDKERSKYCAKNL